MEGCMIFTTPHVSIWRWPVTGRRSPVTAWSIQRDSRKLTKSGCVTWTRLAIMARPVQVIPRISDIPRRRWRCYPWRGLKPQIGATQDEQHHRGSSVVRSFCRPLRHSDLLGACVPHRPGTGGRGTRDA
jgi:hypothetical protein